MKNAVFKITNNVDRVLRYSSLAANCIIAGLLLEFINFHIGFIFGFVLVYSLAKLYSQSAGMRREKMSLLLKSIFCFLCIWTGHIYSSGVDNAIYSVNAIADDARYDLYHLRSEFESKTSEVDSKLDDLEGEVDNLQSQIRWR